MSHTVSFESPRSSMFTFQSSVHSTHVLRCLDEQRQKDVLCDVTILVGDSSFRAHRSVLAACSDYFLANVGNHTGQGHVITLPSKVTVEGFDPLLEFAYTAKLLFTKENIMDIRKCADILGFHNLDNACFEFLLPRFFDSSHSAHMVYRKSRWNKKCRKPKPLAWESSTGVGDDDDDGDDEKNEKEEHTESEHLEEPQTQCDERRSRSCVKPFVAVRQCCSFASEEQEETNCPIRCLKNCETETKKGQSNMKNCPMQCNKTNSRPDVQSFCGDDKDPLQSQQCQSKSYPLQYEKVEDTQLQYEKVEDTQLKYPERHCENPSTGSPGMTEPVNCGGSMGSKGVELNFCSLNFCEMLYPMPIAGHRLAHQVSMCPLAPVPSCSQTQRKGAENGGRTSVEREVAEHLAYMCSEQPRDCPPSMSTDVSWTTMPPRLDPVEKCPFLWELRTQKMQMPACEQQCLAKVSPCMSPAQSGEDSDSDTEGDSECCAMGSPCEVSPPFSVEQITSLSRNDFQQLLKQGQLTQAQLDFVHNVRRRSKNRMAAQRCRKRKLDCIYNLECEIDRLRTEREKLLQEQDCLSQLRFRTRQNLSDLCQQVCREARLRPDQLQVLAKYSAPECPMSVLAAQMSSLSSGMSAQKQGSLLQDILDSSPMESTPPGLPAYHHCPALPPKPNGSLVEGSNQTLPL